MDSRTYARIEDGCVVEIIDTDHDIHTQFHPDFVATLIDVTDVAPQPDQRWTVTQKGGVWTFTAPALPGA